MNVTTENNIRVLLVDDHIILRAGLKSIIQEIPHLQVVGEARTGLEALEILSQKEVDIALMDIQMPEMDGIACTKEIVMHYPNTQVIAVTMHNGEEYVQKMLSAGASGYIPKHACEASFSEAIDAVYTGDHYFENSIVQNLSKISEAPGDDFFSPMNLSDRERDVLRLIIEEKSNSEIAEELFISIRTVDAHRRNLLKKTGSKNTVGLTKYALRHALV